MRPERLLAKSSDDPARPRAEETLPGHTGQVLGAARALLDLRAEASLAAVGLASGLEARLRRIVLLGALVHDVGKCSEHFQAMVRYRRTAAQMMRHEAVSLWLCWPGQPLAAWIRSAVEDEADLVLAVLAAAGHHRKFPAGAVAGDEAGAGSSMWLWLGHPDFRALLDLGRAELGAEPPPPVADVEVRLSRRGGADSDLRRWEADFAERPLAANDRRLLGVAKALVLAADVAGSALPRAGQRDPAWIRAQLASSSRAQVFGSLVQDRLRGAPLRPFQLEVAGSDAPVTLVSAGCGSGKTVAAWAWAAQQHPGRRVWMTYPTTGTATEGFRDYVFGSEVHGRLEHGRALVDIEIFGLDDDDLSRARDRLDAIRAWGVESVTCTVDTVLGLLQNQRKGLYAWPALAGAVVVFDEVHAYDQRLFATLLRFLDALPGVPALLMTASLPAPRLEAVRGVVRRRHGRLLAEIAGPEGLETLPRYTFVESDTPAESVREVLARDGKVLWVSNTVARCMAVARSFPSAYMYHSRFRYRDRVERHGAVIAAFRDPGGTIAATTQVAEISLDLSADLLVTDLAPVPAMIQRLGRLNRRSTPEAPTPPAPCLVLPFAGAPYEAHELEEARDWIRRLHGRPLAQRDLVAAWTQPPQAPPAPGGSAWLDGLFHTEPVHVRDASPGVTVLLEGDAAAVRAGHLRAEEAALPMPPPARGIDVRGWPRVAYLPVAPQELISYDPMRGAEWRNP